ncbi:MAG: porin [Desulfobacterales bacterium]|nr:MAG: porin [Desulfobacterales bacterium]
MKRLAIYATMIIVVFFVCGMVSPSWAGIKADIDEQANLEVGIWAQVWYQWVEDGKVTATGTEDLNDFLIRRAYLYLKGDVTDLVSFFTHAAKDKAGMEKSNEPGDDDLEWRDLWITLNFDKAFMVQMGRMYVPLTRNYGTTSTSSMMTTDLPFLQGGSRGGIFYASKTGRDDGVTLWGNPMDGLLQYRLMISEGVEGEDNPDDNLRFAGRVAVSLLEPETGWFNKGTYLGKKKVLSLGLGFDRQDDIDPGTPLVPGDDDDNQAWTVDVFYDHPVGDGAVTAEAAYIDIEHCTTNQGLTSLAKGDDAKNWYISGGYLFPNHLQPYVRYETVDVDHKYETDFWSVGLNYFMKGHKCKISADYTQVDQESAAENYDGALLDDQDIITVQIAVGF